MRPLISGRRRRVTDMQVKTLREWKSLRQLAREFGISRGTAEQIRRGYQYKQPSP